MPSLRRAQARVLARKSGLVAGMAAATPCVPPARRKQAYEALHPETQQGTPGVSRQVGDTQKRTEADRSTADTAKRTGQSERKVQLDDDGASPVSRDGETVALPGHRVAAAIAPAEDRHS